MPTAFQQSNGELLVDLVVLGEQNIEEDVLGLEGGERKARSSANGVTSSEDPKLDEPDPLAERCATRERGEEH